ncbi:MAG: diaminopimelate decarboxylase [Deltaproteobacteria bacterium]
MTDALSLVDRRFASEGGELLIGGVRVSEIVARFGTPVFVYDLGIIEGKLKLLRSALPSQFSVYYSIKANPNRSILQYFISQGCGLEVASGGEFYQAMQAGCPSGDILFAGPGKSAEEIEYVIGSGIGEIHVESAEELDLIAAIALNQNKTQNIALRINPSEEAQGGAMRMGGRASAFGIDEERLEEIIQKTLAKKSVRFTGVHLFTGTQVLDKNILLKQYKKGIEIAHRASAISGIPISTLDFGGGLGVPYFTNESELDILGFGAELGKLISENIASPNLRDTKFIVEPGRYLAAESGIYIAKVNYVKESRGKRFLILDGGMNHHLAASGNLGQVLKRNFPVAVLNRLDQPRSASYDIVGPLCTPLDTIARDAALPASTAGDLIGVFQSGAYARAASPLGFLSHPSPPEALVASGEAKLIRRRGTYADITGDLS